MPLKSKAQLRKFAAMLNRGEITQTQFDEWTEGVDISKLPERKGQKYPKKRRKKRNA